MAKTVTVKIGDDAPAGIAESNPAKYVSMEAELLRTAASRVTYNSFKSILQDKILMPEARAILSDIGAWYDAHPSETDLDWSAFLAWARLNARSTMKLDKWSVYEAISKNAASLKAPNPSIIRRYHELKGLADIRSVVDEALSSHKPGAIEDIVTVAEGVLSTTRGPVAAGASDLVTDDWATLLSVVQRTNGLKWRLKCLNKSIGPIDKGDSIMIGKRPEVGGTTFLADQMSYMVTQLPKDKHAIIFTNEEVGAKVKVRVIQSALGCTLAQIAADPAKARARYDALMDGKRIDVVHKMGMTDLDVDRWLRTGEYGLIGINVLDKIVLTHSGAEGADLKRDLGIWTRGIADKYGAVFGVLQAGVEAEGNLWPDQSCLYGSKTGLQAESDVMIMIGKTNNPAEAGQRGLGIVRNKLPGGEDTEPGLRHGRWTVKFDGERGRYEDFTS